ncbi:PAB-dependent poly(A)-specific ribonuclease subunit pan2 [Taphrina deformans PYCC 5710]|uniref:PAB-dependent poly(A)-specific ribonuclease subunit pan2 n=1 Tax=Taphrina deformans (strain PYCC 5710 / ATCC 11124 / CBS 356.35 / IMI 108563 / JCM 9778 / NBRC 8474) TaxID=1097556 RepID=R4XCZ6_TAPDE|nr:PAB-dependent poly(A)-specific ribonuclease subunit pan2 [Taphrina deformans PYCC 5710]|eukprot:CCG81195.1 PAB-dependent poly(A)-specific ribonuclease subunit pan2 [Taphrina deformans PYCC 5710]
MKNLSGPVQNMVGYARIIVHSFKDTLELHNATCMAIHPRNSHDLIIAGIKRGMAIVNLEKGTVTEILDNACEDVIIMRSLRHSRTVVCGTAHGEVRIHDCMDPCCPPIQRMQAHSGSLADLIICGGSILTCGYQLRYGNYNLESMVRVFDLKTLRPLIPIQFGAGPAFLKSHPKMTTSALMLSQSGQLQTIDVGNPADIHLRQLTSMSFLTAFEISSSGDALIYSDAENNLHLWTVSHNIEPRFSNLPGQTTFADYVTAAPDFDPTSDPLHVIGMPYYNTELLSSWPANMVFEVGRLPAKIDADIISSMKVVDGIGYAPFHKRRRRNLAEERSSAGNALDIPRFRSEKAKALATGDVKAGLVDNIFEDMGKMSIGTMHIPNYYRRMEIKYSRFGIEDFDFDFFNHTAFSGLETNFSNSYCNSLLQLYNYCRPICRIAQVHAASSCLKENCLLCETGYVFSMLSDAKGQNCQASNFLRTLSTNREANDLGLVLPDGVSTPPIPWASLTQSFNRFLLETLTREALLTSGQGDADSMARGSALDSVAGIYSKVVSKCSCGFETIKPEIQVLQGRDLEKRMSDGRVQHYILRGTVNEIRFDQDEAHMVTFIRAEDSEESPWLLFNDFLVKEVTAEEALTYPGPWKVPAVLSYERINETSSRATETADSTIDMSIIYRDLSVNKEPSIANDFVPLSTTERMSVGTLVAIDAEFVALQQEEIEVRSDGTKHIIQPSRLSLARVSVLRGQGQYSGKPFIDDYIVTTQPVVNYLTAFSGIHEGDLDHARSRRHLVPLKHAYKKLYTLVRAGCVFIGHGLRSDFRIINMNLPKEQVIDTVDLFYLPERQRKLSLKFLSWYFLEEQIQQAEHDSIEDARTALLLYQKYLEFQKDGTFDSRLQEVYDAGRSLNFKVPQ